MQTNLRDFKESPALTMIISPIVLYSICLCLCYAAYRSRWLTGGGSFSAFLMGTLFITVNLATFILPLLLLLGGTLLSKLNRDENEGARTAAQVLANGFVGCFCLLYFLVTNGGLAEDSAFVAYLTSFSVSISDTFSSEIGKYCKGRTIDIKSFRKVEPGLSGGISLQGSLGGLFGALLSAVLSYLIFDISAVSAQFVFFLGFSGMLIDSMLGAALQAKYIDASGNISEYPSTGNALYKGYAWCTNDAVNFLSNMIIVMLWGMIRYVI